LRFIATYGCFKKYTGKSKICNYELLNAGYGCNLGNMATALSSKTIPTQARGREFTSRVLDATLTQLAELGFERLSIPQIAGIVGVNKTSIYRRWPTKADLVREALAIPLSHANDVPDTGALRTDLIALASTVAAFMQSRVGTALIRIMLAEGGNPEVRALANTAYSEAGKHGPWIVIKRATERGELSGDVDPALMLFTVAGAIMHRVFVEQRDAPDEFLEQVVDVVLFGAAFKR
jgi:AcrR family transcriptional regulator